MNYQEGIKEVVDLKRQIFNKILSNWKDEEARSKNYKNSITLTVISFSDDLHMRFKPTGEGVSVLEILEWHYNNYKLIELIIPGNHRQVYNSFAHLTHLAQKVTEFSQLPMV